MNNENKKEYLNQYRYLRNEIVRLQEDANAFRQSILMPVNMSGMPSSHNQKDLSDYIVKCDSLINKIIKKKAQHIKLYEEIENAISNMDDPIEKTVLRLRYIDGYNWEKICTIINYSWKQTHRYHSKALCHFIIPELTHNDT